MPTPERGEVWRVRLDPTEGDEIGKIRPAVVINLNSMGRLNLRVVVPITDWKDRYENYQWMTMLEPDIANGLSKRSGADSFQTRSVSISRFVTRLGKLSETDLQDIADATALMIGFELPGGEQK